MRIHGVADAIAGRSGPPGTASDAAS